MVVYVYSTDIILSVKCVLFALQSSCSGKRQSRVRLSEEKSKHKERNFLMLAFFNVRNLEYIIFLIG